MKKLGIHLAIGIGLLVLAFVTPACLIWALDWLDKHAIVGASWLRLCTWEIVIGTGIVFILWIVSLFGLACRWHNRFRIAAAWYVRGILGLAGGLVVVAVPGFISMWLYQHGIWPVGMVFRLVEIVAAIGVLGGLAYWVIGMVLGMFIAHDSQGHMSEVSVTEEARESEIEAKQELEHLKELLRFTENNEGLINRNLRHYCESNPNKELTDEVTNELINKLHCDRLKLRLTVLQNHKAMVDEQYQQYQKENPGKTIPSEALDDIIDGIADKLFPNGNEVAQLTDSGQKQPDRVVSEGPGI